MVDMIWSIITIIVLIFILCYAVVSVNNHWKEVEFQATLLMEASLKKEKGKDDNERWIPVSQVNEDSEDEMEEQDILFFEEEIEDGY